MLTWSYVQVVAQRYAETKENLYCFTSDLSKGAAQDWVEQ